MTIKPYLPGRYEVMGEESGERRVFSTLKAARAFIKEVKAFDQRQGLEGENWTIVDITTGKTRQG